jgi:hypothetical protein
MAHPGRCAATGRQARGKRSGNRPRRSAKPWQAVWQPPHHSASSLATASRGWAGARHRAVQAGIAPASRHGDPVTGGRRGHRVELLTHSDVRPRPTSRHDRHDGHRGCPEGCPRRARQGGTAGFRTSGGRLRTAPPGADLGSLGRHQAGRPRVSAVPVRPDRDRGTPSDRIEGSRLCTRAGVRRTAAGRTPPGSNSMWLPTDAASRQTATAPATRPTHPSSARPPQRHHHRHPIAQPATDPPPPRPRSPATSNPSQPHTLVSGRYRSGKAAPGLGRPVHPRERVLPLRR